MLVKKDIASEFDQFSAEYSEDMLRCVPHYAKLLDCFVDYIPENIKVHKVLDLGCGNGNVIKLLLRRFPDAEYTLVDASPEMLRICRSRFPDARLILLERYFNDLELVPDHYDLITASFSFHHLVGNDKKQIFKKCHTALKKNGILMSSDLMINKLNPDHPALLVEWGDFVRSNYPNADKWEWLMEHYDAFDRPDNLSDQLMWLKEAGFTTVEVPWNEGYWANFRAVK